ncbi:hypothetical protein GRJ2_001753400 [Grus japonensis]|uniref:Uncharacterized protein n=1 Tax=Grus japonensis TaxID=30415 RepID=A0ABC9X5C3_GRUJA
MVAAAAAALGRGRFVRGGASPRPPGPAVPAGTGRAPPLRALRLRSTEKCPEGHPARSATWLHSSDSARDEQGMRNAMVPSAQHRIPGSSVR